MNNSEQMNDIIGRLMATGDPEETRQIYREWSESYDQDLASFGYVAPQIGVTLLTEALADPGSLIFDAGCGTGLCGQALAERGYTRIHGADFSPAMLSKARETGHYEKLSEADFSQPLSVEPTIYDGIICCGVYKSLFREYFLGEMLRITKPDGVLCMSCRDEYFDNDLLLQAQAHEEAGRLTIESIDKKSYMVGQGAEAAYIVLRKTQ